MVGRWLEAQLNRKEINEVILERAGYYGKVGGFQKQKKLLVFLFIFYF